MSRLDAAQDREQVGIAATDEPPELAPVRPGEDLDWDRIGDYLRDQLGLSGDLMVRQFPNGSANLTYLLTFGSTRVVLRRPPLGTIAPGAHDMQREYTVLAALDGLFAKAPTPLHFCGDEKVAGAPFFVMSYVAGVVVRNTLPAAMRAQSTAGAAARQVGFALADAVAELHQVPTDVPQTREVGRPIGYVARQLAGWHRRWALVQTAELNPHVDRIHQRLVESMPQSPRVAFLHNDLKLDNCVFDPTRPDAVLAVLDWDMGTLGDPLVDLGTLLNYWPDEGPRGRVSAVLFPGTERLGLPTREQMSQRYAEATGFDLGQLDWYLAFASWKTAVALQQLAARAYRGETLDERMAGYGNVVADALDLAAELLGAP